MQESTRGRGAAARRLSAAQGIFSGVFRSGARLFYLEKIVDATVFRFVAQELAAKICGVRLEKVFAPLPGCWTFDLGRPGFLVVHAGKPSPFLFLTAAKPENPPRPSGQAMWLRKRLRGRRVLDVMADWPRRRLALSLSPGEGTWLVISLSAKPMLVDALPPEFGLEPVFPGVEDILADPDIWKTHPHITPPLRRYLQSISPEAGNAFLQEFQVGAAPSFYVGSDHRERMCIRLWPLQNGQHFTQALEAAEYAGTRILAALIKAQSGDDAAASRAERRLRRTLGRLEDDRKRLEAMVAGRKQALLLQGHLHALSKDERLPEIEVPGVGGMERIVLNPALTVRENMERLFARATKGERGLVQVAARRKMLLHASPTPNLPTPQTAVSPSAGKSPLPARFRNIKVAAFRSSDGFFIFRGRSAQANHQLLTKAASPFDYWLHAQDGPGAHVIIKRDFPTQEVPERTIQEAAGLAALASHLKMAESGDVLLCLVRDVRTIKGAALGMVDVRQVLRTVRAAILPELEQRLGITG